MSHILYLLPNEPSLLPRTGPVVLERIMPFVNMPEDWVTGRSPLDEHSTDSKFLERPCLLFQTSSRRILREAREKLERDLYRYEDLPVSSRFPLSTWKTPQPTLLAIASERVHPALEKGPSR
jgi:hypothetical protein